MKTYAIGRNRVRAFCLFVLVPLALGCAGVLSARKIETEGSTTMTITSPVFANGAVIPAKYTSEGRDVSPPLKWDGVPPGTRSLVLIVDDPDAPDPKAPRMTWVHWVLYNIPPDATGLPEGVESRALPAGTREGVNDWKKTGYGGPAPPIGRHRYFHKLFALDTVLEGLDKPAKVQVEAAMKGHVLARAELMGIYGKSKAAEPPVCVRKRTGRQPKR